MESEGMEKAIETNESKNERVRRKTYERSLLV